MGEENSEQILIHRCLHGENDAFDDLLSKYKPKLTNIVYQTIDEHDHIPDVVQEILIKIFCNLSQYRGDSNFYTWIYRIAVNTAISYVKKNQYVSCFNSHHLAWNDVENTMIVEQRSPELKVFHEEILNQCCRQFNRLPSELQRSLLLREFEGLSYDEIAQIMQCPIGTVRSRIHRAKVLLMDNMEAEDEVLH